MILRSATEITVSYENSEYIYTYQYDSKNQLIRENNPSLNKTITYSYDNYGNITSSSTYNYTTSNSLGTALSTETYTYGNSNWKDLLTSYNNQSITYDSTGHPLQYYDGKLFTWSYGRLTGYTKNNDAVSYTYNADGIRTSKTVNGVTTEYLVSGNKILQDTSPNKNIIYEYDESGSLRSLVYNPDFDSKKRKNPK